MGDDTLEQETLGAPGGEAAPGTLQRGAMLGRFVLLEKLGAGGMGVVYSAYDGRLDRRVAIKLLRPDAWGPVTSEAGRERLLREAQAMARLSHPNVVTVYEVGTVGEQLFVAMEYVEGQTLRAWLSEASRSPREVLRTLVAAGRGLAAAHRKGLVHRDFKPENVLVGADGRVRVTDFGLVREEGEEVPVLDGPVPAAGAPHPSHRTRSGLVLGTPGFMAPEQARGERVDARADQYAFCATLCLALFGRLPGEREARELPGDGRLPLRVRQALRRGLSQEPEERFASMEALLAALDVEGSPARVWPWVALATLMLLAGLGALRAARGGEAVCGGARAKLAGVWDADVRTAVRNALVAADGTAGADAAARIEARLDTYARQWADMHTEACEATAVRKEQSSQLLDLRMACLERRRSALAATTGLLVGARDVRVSRKAVELVQGLEEVSGCADVEALTAAYPPPQDAGVRQQVQALRSRLDAAQALVRAAQNEDAIVIIQDVLSQARPLSYPPLVAEAVVQLGVAQMGKEDGNAAERTLLEGAGLAAQARDDTLAATAWTRLVQALIWQARYGEAALMGQVADAAVTRAGGSTRLRASLYNILHILHQRQGRLAEAEKSLAQAVRLIEEDPKALPALAPFYASLLNNSGIVLTSLGRYDEARAKFQQAHARYVQEFGPESLLATLPLQNLGSLAFSREQLGEALILLQASLRTKQRLLRPDSTSLADVLVTASMPLGRLGRLDEAQQSLEQALVIQQKNHGPEHPDVAFVLHNLGDVAFLRRNFGEAARLHERALRMAEKSRGHENWFVASALEALGRDSLALGRLARAEADLMKAAEVWRGLHGPESLEMVRVRGFLAEVHLAAGLPRKAREHLEWAEGLLERTQAPPTVRARTSLALARALWPLEARRPEALRLVQASLGLLERAEGLEARELLDEAQGWMRERPPETGD